MEGIKNERNNIMLQQEKFQQHSFLKWLWSDRENKLLLYLSGVVIILQLVWFKYLYPFPNFLPDSYSYLQAALLNQSINVWPIGYSKFIRLFSCFSHSHLAFISFQYVLLQGMVLYFIFSIRYWFMPSKWIIRLLVICNVLNPLSLYVSNFISSDSLFAALSILWFTQLMWLFYHPTTRLVFAHSIVLLVVFTIRYNALYYPIISILAFTIAPMKRITRYSGILTTIFLLGGFLLDTIEKYSTETGTRQFSAFAGWQLASNALFAYAHVPNRSNDVPQELQSLHTIVNRHLDSLNKLKHRPDDQLGIYYLWDDKAPLKSYLGYTYSKDSTTDGLRRWISMGPVYSAYGTYLIKRYPLKYARYYLLPNFINYYAPPAEFLGIYNMGTENIEPIAKDWFHLKSTSVYTLTKGKIIKITDSLTIVIAIINLVFVLSLASFIFLGGFQTAQHDLIRLLKWVFLIWMSNLMFSVLASPIVMRYQLFPVIVTFISLILLLHFIIEKAKAEIPEGMVRQKDLMGNEAGIRLS